jgi:hypothetical protein
MSLIEDENEQWKVNKRPLADYPTGAERELMLANRTMLELGKYPGSDEEFLESLKCVWPPDPPPTVGQLIAEAEEQIDEAKQYLDYIKESTDRLSSKTLVFFRSVNEYYESHGYLSDKQLTIVRKIFINLT